MIFDEVGPLLTIPNFYHCVYGLSVGVLCVWPAPGGGGATGAAGPSQVQAGAAVTGPACHSCHGPGSAGTGTKVSLHSRTHHKNQNIFMF